MSTNVQSIDTAREAHDIAEIRELLALEESAPKRAIRLGELFTIRKIEAGHGNWDKWLKANEFAHRTATTYMRAYEASKLASGASLKETVRATAARAPSQRPAPAPAVPPLKPKESYGWISAVSRFSGLTQQWGGSQARTISKALGYDITDRQYTEAEAKEMAAQAALCFAEPPPLSEYNLTKTEEKLVDRAIRQEVAKLRREAQEALNAEMEKRMQPILKEYGEAIDAANKSKADYELWAKDLPEWMSREEFRNLRGCCAAHNAPQGMEDKYHNASVTLNRLAKRFKD